MARKSIEDFDESLIGRRVVEEEPKAKIPKQVIDTGFKHLYFKTEDAQFVTIKENVALKYIQDLVKAIQGGSETIEILNGLNDKLLAKAQFTLALFDDNDDGTKLKELVGLIGTITANQKTLFDNAKNSSSNLEVLLSLEKKLLSDAQERRELYGGKVKGFREDKSDYEVDKNNIEIKTANTFI